MVSTTKSLLVVLGLVVPGRSSFVTSKNGSLAGSIARLNKQENFRPVAPQRDLNTQLMMAQVSEKEAQVAINKVVQALKKDKSAKDEIGNLVSVNNVLGYGSPREGTLAVRFNASFKKGGMGRSSVPMPFGLGQTNESEGRGTMVGQVKADVDTKSGKVTSCSVFRDLGYGRAFNLKL